MMAFAQPALHLEPRGRVDVGDWLAAAIPAAILAMVASLLVLGENFTVVLLLIAIPGALIVLAFTSPERATMLFFGYCAVEGLFKTMAAYQSLVHVGRDLVLGVIILGALFRFFSRGERARSLPPSTILIVLFTAACLVQLFNPFSIGMSAGIAALRMHLGAIPLYFIGYYAFENKAQIRRFVWFTAYLGVVLAAIALLQQAEGRAWTDRVFPGSDYVHSATFYLVGSGVFWRPPSTTSDGGGASTWIQVTVPACFAIFWLIRQRRWLAWIVLPGSLTILFGGLIVSSIRAMALIALLEGIVCIVVFPRRSELSRFLPALLLAVGLATVAWQLFDGSSAGVVATRFDVVRNPLAAYQLQRGHNLTAITEDISKAPLGAGLGRTGPAAAEFSDQIVASPVPGFSGDGYMNSETYFAGMLSETGIPGAVLISILSGVLLVRGFRVALQAHDPVLRVCGLALSTIILGVIVSYFSGPSLYQPPLSIYFWLGAGILAKLPEVDAATDPASDRRTIDPRFATAPATWAPLPLGAS